MKTKFNFSLIAFAILFYSCGQKLPDFKLVSIVGDTISSEFPEGKVVYINVFETWCVPCLSEIPELNKLKEKHPNILFIAMTPAKKSKVLEFQKKNAFNFNVISDAGDLCKKMKVHGFPSHFFVDKHGTLRSSSLALTTSWNHTATEEEIRTRYRELTYNILDSLMTKYENE